MHGRFRGQCPGSYERHPERWTLAGRWCSCRTRSGREVTSPESPLALPLAPHPLACLPQLAKNTPTCVFHTHSISLAPGTLSASESLGVSNATLSRPSKSVRFTSMRRAINGKQINPLRKLSVCCRGCREGVRDAVWEKTDGEGPSAKVSSGQKPAGNEAGSARAIWGERLKGGGTGSTKQAKQMCDCGDEGRQDIQRAEMVWECGERPTSLCLTRASFRDTGSKGPCANKDPMLGLVACCHHSEIPNTFFF